MTRTIYLAAFVCLLNVVAIAPAAHAQATVSYQGFLYNQLGNPIQNGRVIAGTFKPGFNVSNYNCIYGDFACNTDGDNYSHAVADGNFLPFDSGVLSGPFGFFSGSAVSSAAGSKVWLFAFPTSQAAPINGTEVLASSTDPSYILPAAGLAPIDASKTNQFVLGVHVQNGIGLSGLPDPEPGSGALLALAAMILGAGRVRRGPGCKGQRTLTWPLPKRETDKY